MQWSPVKGLEIRPRRGLESEVNNLTGSSLVQVERRKAACNARIGNYFHRHLHPKLRQKPYVVNIEFELDRSLSAEVQNTSK